VKCLECGVFVNCDATLLQQINDVIDQHVRPSLEMDGGDVEVVSLDENKLFVRLKGACGECPCASDTLKCGVQRTLNQMVSEDLVVVSV
jgi:Fe-S cluster biogenesis protein NfuA